MGTSSSRELTASSGVTSTHEKHVKGQLLDRLLERVLEAFAEIDPFSEEKSPTFFLVYAHDAPNVGKADAALARKLIDLLKVLRAKVISDRSLFSGPWHTREDGVVRDILSNQFCLLPKSGNAGSVDNTSRVDKVILCCSEVLQSYYEDSHMKTYTQAIKDFYFEIGDPKKTDEVKKGIEGIVKIYYDKKGFHHMLTELAFLEIRSIREEGHHGIIPVVLNGDGIKSLPFFNSGVPLWLKPQGHSKSMMHECQALHRLLFNLLRQIYTDKHRRIDQFERCYNDCFKMLSPESSLPSPEKLEDLVSCQIRLTLERVEREICATIRTARHLTPGKAGIAGAQDFACLRSLAYAEMNYRRQDTKRAHANTCDWITRHQSYTEWLEEGSGILWIKGKPGSGKSTLMEFLLRDLDKQAQYQKSIRLSFFLHGRGTPLQKSRLGMFRSLLHQLLLSAPAARDKFQHEFEERCRSQGEPGRDWNWHVNELRDFFVSAIENVAGTQPVNIFVDALDEADDGTHDQDTSNQIVSDFHELNDLLHYKELRSTICFSCRHFPIITASQRWEIWVEKGNHEDISTYVCGELERILSPSAAERQYVEEWQETIVWGAQGVFQWAVLVVKMTIKYHIDGKSPRETRQMLIKVPEKLGDVYKHILTEVVDKDDQQQTLRLMRWVFLAERPLTVTEGRFAMCLPDTEIITPDLSPIELELPTHDFMVKRITSLSGGLIESKQHEEGQILQFIHQSVNDFLSREGLGLLEVASRGNPVGQGHHQLSVICANYMRLAEMNNSNKPDAKSINSQLPFVDYATKSWFLHAEKAETIGIPQDYLLRFSQHCPKILERWAKIYGILDEDVYSERRPAHASTMLHIASGSNLLSVVKVLLSIGLHIEQMDDSGNRALHYASRWGHVKVVKALLDAGAILEVENNANCTALERAAANGHEEVVRLLLATGADVNKQAGQFGNALYGAAAKGSISIVRVLLNHGAEVNAQGGRFGNALQVAAYKGHQATVQLLLDKGADFNAQSGEYGNALQAAAYGGNQATFQLLLDKGAEVNAQGGVYGNALQATALGGHQATVQLLLDKGAKVNAQGGHFGNALQAAANRGNQAIIQLLLDKGADVNAQGGEYGNALQAAARGRYQAIVQLLLDNGAEVNAQGGLYGNALQAAARGGYQAIVQLLLDNGAEVNAQGGEYGNALQATVVHWDNQAIVQLLLDKGADVNAQGGHFGNALQATVVHGGNQAIIQLLLDKGADVNVQGGHFGNALQAAAIGGYQAIIQLLLDKGAKVNAQGGEFGNALQAAAYRGNQAIIQLLLDKGADVNAQGGEYGNALQAAVYRGYQAIIQLLLDNGADVLAE